MVSVRLPSDALLQHLPSYLGFSYLGRGVSLHGCSSKAQQLLLTLDEGYLLTATVPDLQRGIAPLGPPVPVQLLLLGMLLKLRALALGMGGSSQLLSLAWGSGWLLRVTTPGLRHKVSLRSSCPWPRARSGSSGSLPLASGARCLLPAAPALGCRIAPLGCP